MTPAQRVAKGAALLDERVPGWWERVSIPKLRMHSCCDCMLGQLFGDYSTGLYELQCDEIDEINDRLTIAEAHGFDITDSETSWVALHDAWVLIIAERQAVDRRYTPVGEKCVQPGCPNLQEGLSSLCPSCWDLANGGAP